MRGHDPGVKPWLVWVWRLPGHDPPRVRAWPRSVHKARPVVLPRRIGIHRHKGVSYPVMPLGTGRTFACPWGIAAWFQFRIQHILLRGQLP